jgi:hypothetical protein
MRKGSVEKYGREPKTTRGLVTVHKYLACMGVCELSVMRRLGAFECAYCDRHEVIQIRGLFVCRRKQDFKRTEQVSRLK